MYYTCNGKCLCWLQIRENDLKTASIFILYEIRSTILTVLRHFRKWPASGISTCTTIARSTCHTGIHKPNMQNESHETIVSFFFKYQLAIVGIWQRGKEITDQVPGSLNQAGEPKPFVIDITICILGQESRNSSKSYQP